MDAHLTHSRCWFYKLLDPVFFILGRFGDEMIILPGLKVLHDRLGVTPIVVVSKEFANIFDGVSYAKAHPVIFDSLRQVRTAIQFAISIYGDDLIVPKFWDDPRRKPPAEIPPPWFPDGKGPLGDVVTIKRELPVPSPNGHVRLTANGQTWVMAKSDWENYMVSQWEHSGFTHQQLLDWPLVFDRRDPVAEESLRKQIFRSHKPKLLYNLSGFTNPAPSQHRQQLTACIQSFASKFEVINLAPIRARRIYDLLGLYDAAAIIVSSDTATLHLAAATKTPYIALLANGGAGSVPRGANCVLKVRYNLIPQQLKEITGALSEAL